MSVTFPRFHDLLLLQICCYFFGREFSNQGKCRFKAPGVRFSALEIFLPAFSWSRQHEEDRRHHHRRRLVIVANTGEVLAIELSRDQAGALYEELSIVTHVQLGPWGGAPIARWSPVSCGADLPPVVCCAIFPGEMNLVRSFGEHLSQDMQAISIG